VTDEVRAQLLPLLDQVLESVADQPDDRLRAFFGSIRSQLEHAASEEELLTPFLRLAGTAPLVHSVGVDPFSLMVIDVLLERAQELAQTLSADGRVH